LANVTEIAPDVYRISIYESQFELQFNHFLVKDKDPLLFHAGMKGMFPLIREALARIIDPATIRWIGFSHFESDECGSLNEWLQVAPLAQPLCTVVGVLVNVSDFASRAPRWILENDRLSIHSIAELHLLQFHHRAPDGEVGRTPAEDPGNHAWVLVCGRWRKCDS
jgi:hypothetical protein